jgi:BASS family bile acid:Na+ symporter
MVGLGMFIAWVLKLNVETALAYLVEHTIRQEGTGIYIAISVVGSSTATWPLLINTVVGTTVGVVMVVVARRLIRRMGD